MSDVARAIMYVEALELEIERWRDNQAGKTRGGQSVGYMGYQFTPSTAVMLEWNLREIRKALTEP